MATALAADRIQQNDWDNQSFDPQAENAPRDILRSAFEPDYHMIERLPDLAVCLAP